MTWPSWHINNIIFRSLISKDFPYNKFSFSNFLFVFKFQHEGTEVAIRESWEFLKYLIKSPRFRFLFICDDLESLGNHGNVTPKMIVYLYSSVHETKGTPRSRLLTLFSLPAFCSNNIIGGFTLTRAIPHVTLTSWIQKYVFSE